MQKVWWRSHRFIEAGENEAGNYTVLIEFWKRLFRGYSQRTSGWPRGRGRGVCGIRTFNCYSSVILLFYPDAGGGGSRNPGFSRTSFVNGPLLISYCKSFPANHAYFPKCVICQFIASFYCPFFTPHSAITLAKVIKGGWNFRKILVKFQKM